MEARHDLACVAAAHDRPAKRSAAVVVAQCKKSRGARANAENCNRTSLVPIDSPVGGRVAEGAAEACVGPVHEEEAHNVVAAVTACEERGDQPPPPAPGIRARTSTGVPLPGHLPSSSALTM